MCDPIARAEHYQLVVQQTDVTLVHVAMILSRQYREHADWLSIGGIERADRYQS